jgi:hypothetical protein
LLELELAMRTVYLIASTFGFSLVVGASAIWFNLLDPWRPPFLLIANWLMEFRSIAARHDFSESFCRSCGDQYIKTLIFFLILSIIYLAVVFARIASILYHSWNDAKADKVHHIALVRLYALVGFLIVAMAGIAYFLLISGAARPSSVSPSQSERSAFGFMLFFQVNVVFHIFFGGLLLLLALSRATSSSHNSSSTSK